MPLTPQFGFAAIDALVTPYDNPRILTAPHLHIRYRHTGVLYIVICSIKKTF